MGFVTTNNTTTGVVQTATQSTGIGYPLSGGIIGTMGSIDVPYYEYQRVLDELNSLRNWQYSKPPPSEKESTPALMRMIAMRMRWDAGYIPKYGYITAIKNQDRVIVLIVNDDSEPVTLKDEWGIFPSDALIASLRLLENK